VRIDSADGQRGAQGSTQDEREREGRPEPHRTSGEQLRDATLCGEIILPG
jgi:hypothetical protein